MTLRLNTGIDHRGYDAATAARDNGRGEPITDVNLEESAVMLPLDLQSRYSKMVQTHSGATIPPNSSNPSTWFSSDGFDKLCGSLINDSNTSSSFDIEWSYDGSTVHGYETVLPTATMAKRPFETGVKAPFYRTTAKNSDGALPHTMNAWVYLKV